jgi:F-type H+-transporting ATPase subunit alpha
VPLDEQVIGIYAVTNSLADDVPVGKIGDFEAGLLQFMRTVHPEVGQAIMAEKVLTDEIKESLEAAIREYKQTASF